MSGPGIALKPLDAFTPRQSPFLSPVAGGRKCGGHPVDAETGHEPPALGARLTLEQGGQGPHGSDVRGDDG